MKILAIYNLKGGVGKTAAAVNLGWLSAADGARTLVWDLDPQGAASFYFRIRPRLAGGAKKLLARQDALAQVRGTDRAGLDLLPADFSLRHLDRRLGDLKKPGKILADLLLPLADRYDRVFIDCPPSISRVSEAVFVLADALLVPTIPTTLSLRTLEQVTDHLERKGPKNLPVLPFFSMVDRRKRLHRDLVTNPPPGFLRSLIPSSSQVERMGTERSPVVQFAPRSVASTAFRQLADEVFERLEDL